MTDGPPPSAAESSSSSHTGQRLTRDSASNSVEIPKRQSYTSSSIGSTPYYNYGSFPTNWSPSTSHQHTQHYLPPPYTPHQQAQMDKTLEDQKRSASTAKRSPSPPPPIPAYQHWDQVIKTFLTEAGLLEALRGFESDMLVLSRDWEEEKIPRALKSMVEGLTKFTELTSDDGDTIMKDGDDKGSLEERKLDYVHLANNEVPRSKTSINKSISVFLAQKRARNNASNRTEFLYSLAEKRRRLQAEGSSADPTSVASCARADARPIDRDEQMKYDIAKNEGPLTRTIKDAHNLAGGSSSKMQEKTFLTTEQLLKRRQSDDHVTSTRYPALDERLKNVEAHFAVRYVPSPPKNLIGRLKLLEDHIINLEKEYPSWAALHFNQPHRGWPPPPRSTPIIVPPNLRPIEKDSTASATPAAPTSTSTVPSTSLNAPKARNNKSSLHRAVMERLEVQQAMKDLRTVALTEET